MAGQTSMTPSVTLVKGEDVVRCSLTWAKTTSFLNPRLNNWSEPPPQQTEVKFPREAEWCVHPTVSTLWSSFYKMRTITSVRCSTGIVPHLYRTLKRCVSQDIPTISRACIISKQISLISSALPLGSFSTTLAPPAKVMGKASSKSSDCLLNREHPGRTTEILKVLLPPLNDIGSSGQ